MSARPVDVVEGPRVETRAAVPTIGIREIVPFRTMLAQRDRLLKELVLWLAEHGVEPEGPFFLRLHVVNMSDLMDIEVGVAASTAESDDRVRPGVLPAGDYAVLSYRRTSLGANGLLQSWARQQGLTFDAKPVASGDAWVCRCEIYLTDPRTQPRKTEWIVELAFLTAP